MGKTIETSSAKIPNVCQIGTDPKIIAVAMVTRGIVLLDMTPALAMTIEVEKPTIAPNIANNRIEDMILGSRMYSITGGEFFCVDTIK